MVAMTVVLTAVLYIMVMGLTGEDVSRTRYGTVTSSVISSTSFDLEFVSLSPRAKPMDLKVLVEFGDQEGSYTFGSNLDGDLTSASGTDIVDIYYNDQTDNSYVSSGDYLRFTNCSPGGSYKVYILDSVSGASIVSRTVDLPS